MLRTGQTHSRLVPRIRFGHLIVSSVARRQLTPGPASSRPPEDDSDELLDITPFGNYNLVLPEDPAREGVSHIIPAVVPRHIPRPPYAISFDPALKSSQNGRAALRKSSTGLELPLKLAGMRLASSIAALALLHAQQAAQPGVTTKQLNDVVHQTIIDQGAYPSPLMYKGFPMSCCTSVNNIIAHGIPDDRPLEEGDIVNVDVTVYKNGWHGDTSKTFLVGNVDEQGRDLVDATDEALLAGIRACGPGVPFREIGKTIEKLAHHRGFSVSSEFLGHGIGRRFHKPPYISHVANEESGVMEVGHFFTIEPALVQGTDPSGWILPDGWTVLTETGARSAQAEHTIAITPDGVEILTTTK